MNMLPNDAPLPYLDMFSSDYSGNFRGGIDDISVSSYLQYVDIKSIALAEVDCDYIAALFDNGLAYMDK